ncbi:PorV/PorQ family protein [Natronospora cellulosivora (SeqCode)]
MKKLLLILFVVSFLVIVSMSAYACVGARPLGMGGAFISVADDVNAIYWNPAGLTQLDGFELTYTRTINNRDIINYNDFIGVAGKNDELGFSYGLAYIGEGYDYSFYYFDNIVEIDQNTNWFILSLAKDFSDIINGLSLGSNVRLVSINEEMIIFGDKYSDSDSMIALDFSALYQVNERLTAGVLIQDFFETEFELFGEKFYYIRNIRPSVSYKVYDYLTVASSIYDLRDEHDRKISLGGELNFSAISDFAILDSNKENIFLRGGFYLGNLTLGMSYEYEDFQFDYVFLGGDLENTQQIGVTYRFDGF